VPSLRCIVIVVWMIAGAWPNRVDLI